MSANLLNTVKLVKEVCGEVRKYECVAIRLKITFFALACGNDSFVAQFTH